MPAEVVSDLLMKFVDSNGTTIEGESQTKLNLKASDLTRGFQAGRTFELASFSFSTGLGGDDEDQATKDMKAAHNAFMKELRDKAKKLAGMTDKDLPALPKGTGDYRKFRDGDDSTVYPVDMKPVEFERWMDTASATLLQNCINRQVFQTASLIKRKPAGGKASGEVFLRMDFQQVLLSKVAFSDSMPIKEKYEFVCRAVTIHYLPQLPDGSLGAPLQAFWSAAPGLNPINLKDARPVRGG